MQHCSTAAQRLPKISVEKIKCFSASFHYAENEIFTQDQLCWLQFTTLTAVDSIRRWNLTVCTQARQTSPRPSFGLGSDCCTAYYTVLLYCNPGCIALSVQQRLMSLHRGYRPPTKFAAQVCCNEHICLVGSIAQNANCTGSLLYYQSQKLDNLLQEELIQVRCMLPTRLTFFQK